MLNLKVGKFYSECLLSQPPTHMDTLQFDHIYTGIRSAYSVNSLINHTTRDARSMHQCYEQKGDTIVKTLERSLNPSHALDIAQIELNPYGPKL